MRVGAFELKEPLPDLGEGIAFTMLSPWIDVGGVGSSTLATLEDHFHAEELGKLARPGLFYDFTRYRPMMYLVEDRRDVRLPNTFVKYARRQGGGLLFLHCLEPHMLGETYAESVLKVLERLGVRRHCLLGGMYDTVPHTRPLIVSGTASDQEMELRLGSLKVYPSGYQGPTTINILISEQAPGRGIETFTLVVRLPTYMQLEVDYSGQYALLDVLCRLFDFSLDLGEVKRKGEEQYRKVGLAVSGNPEAQKLIKAMEGSYDARVAEIPPSTPPLSPEIERFLRDIGRRFGSS